MKNFLFIIIIFLISSCTHTFMRGTVAKKLNEKEVIVCLGQNDVKVGDIVKFQQNECSRSKNFSDLTMHELNTTSGGYTEHTGEGQSTCELIYLGRGKVIRLINDHYSVVETNGDFKLETSTQVEIIR